MYKMRILHIIDILGSGGIETLLSSLNKNIDQEECEFNLVYHNSPYDLMKGDRIPALCSFQYKAPAFWMVNLYQYRKWWKDFLKSHGKFDIVHIHDYFDSFPFIKSILIKNNPRTKFVFHAHSLKGHTISVYNLWRSLLAYPVRFFGDYYLGCSNQVILNRFGKNVYEGTKKAILNCGINTERFRFNQNVRDEIRKQYEANDKIVIGHIGRFTEVKNHSFLIDFFNVFHSMYGNSQLWLVGEGELLPEIKHKVRSLNLIDDVKFMGFSSCPEKFMMGMDFFVFPSKSEGLGLVLVEAQTTGLACIVSDAIQPEADMHCGLLKIIKLNDPMDIWIKAVESFMGYTRSDHSYNVVKNGYDIKGVASDLVLLYSNLLKE